MSCDVMCRHVLNCAGRVVSNFIIQALQGKPLTVSCLAPRGVLSPGVLQVNILLSAF